MAERIPIAFLAGLVSVDHALRAPARPGLPLGGVGGRGGPARERGHARRIVVASIPFFVGFTLVFVALGAGAAAVGG